MKFKVFRDLFGNWGWGLNPLDPRYPPKGKLVPRYYSQEALDAFTSRDDIEIIKFDPVQTKTKKNKSDGYSSWEEVEDCTDMYVYYKEKS